MGVRTSAPPEMPNVPLPWKKLARDTLVHSTLLAALLLRAESRAWMASWGTSAPGLPLQESAEMVQPYDQGALAI